MIVAYDADRGMSSGTGRKEGRELSDDFGREGVKLACPYLLSANVWIFPNSGGSRK